jgi:hypothetical protein
VMTGVVSLRRSFTTRLSARSIEEVVEGISTSG